MTNSTQQLAVVTGGAGFVGSHLCERLVKEGYAVISLDNYFTGTPENHVEGVAYRTGHTKDIAALIAETPDIVFHLGEYARTEKSFEDVELVWDLNKTGTFAVAEFCRRRGSKLVYAGSSTKFADGGDGRDQSPYAWTKATNTELVNNYAAWFGLEYAIVYFYNVYGPREMSGSFGTLIRIFTELYRNGQPLTVTAPGTQKRNYTHVYDIVDGIILAAKEGQGDGYGIGADQQFSVLDVAELFGGEVVMMPERKGNRMTAGADNAKVKALGWKQKHTLPEWIAQVKAEIGTVQSAEQRVLVYSTTFFPYAGAAELALRDLIKALPNVQFDVITTKFTKDAMEEDDTIPNVTLHRVGYGHTFDKYLLPFLGARISRQLRRQRSYMFQWTLFASYGALAALFSGRAQKLPLLVTLADQKVANIPWYARVVFRHVLGQADQVYAMDTYEAQAAISLTKRTALIRSIGAGDAFANQVRFTYTEFFRKRLAHTDTV
ncbi:NAD-dependent epimerase/dehydratase family protein [Candidatus Kaiserbacteria bacterium]|nr:NAD-dependent epimerase/dehydratase family protein [Candidatus Kaiserbacteria bacterium]MCB9812580.1 NAD-dependent epimerase/dehydratase family protein [Candidatus Nomurabacteria bacterium]